jgi:hypothetical protein
MTRLTDHYGRPMIAIPRHTEDHDMHARYPTAVIVHYDDAPPITIPPAHNIAAELDAALALYDRVFLDEGAAYTSESLCRTSQAREILHKMRVALLA